MCVDHLLLKGMVQEKIDLVNIKGSLYASNFGAQHIPIRAPRHLHDCISSHEAEGESLEELPGHNPLILS